MIIYRLGKDWNQGVQKEIQLPLRKGHLKQIWQNVRDLTKLRRAAQFVLSLYCSSCSRSSNNNPSENSMIKIANIKSFDAYH